MPKARAVPIKYTGKKEIAYHRKNVQKALDKAKIKPEHQKLYHRFLKGHASDA